MQLMVIIVVDQMTLARHPPPLLVSPRPLTMMMPIQCMSTIHHHVADNDSELLLNGFRAFCNGPDNYNKILCELSLKSPIPVDSWSQLKYTPEESSSVTTSSSISRSPGEGSLHYYGCELCCLLVQLLFWWKLLLLDCQNHG